MSETTFNPYQVPAHAKPIDVTKLTFYGSMNNPVQVWLHDDDSSKATIHNYMPRKNSIVEIEMDLDEAKVLIQEQIERMKIAICLFEEFLEDKRNHVYYWELEKEKN
jgi:hypothetical protein